jgi:hypothetical protein
MLPVFSLLPVSYRTTDSRYHISRAKHIVDETEEWAKVVKYANIKPE